MRALLAAMPTDRISHAAILLAGSLCGVLVFFVAVPLALSNPFPAPREREWVIQRYSLQAAPPISVPDQIEAPTLWDFVSLPAHEGGLAFAPAARPQSSEAAAPVAKRAAVMDDVDAYLWEVYRRAPVKRDSTGDFTWKDPAAAKRMGVSMPAYVIRGMDPDFREQLYHAGRAMDAAGIRWSMLSAFRDDYRQRIASGLKAAAGNSAHGGSARTGGYGHGQAIDVTAADGNDNAVWRWLDAHGAKYGLYRPLPGADPAHVQPRSGWHKLAVALRSDRLGSADGTRVARAVMVKTRYAHADR
jgi:D-alanyl-D-alanine carboxypeptidase